MVSEGVEGWSRKGRSWCVVRRKGKLRQGGQEGEKVRRLERKYLTLGIEFVDFPWCPQNFGMTLQRKMN